MDGESAQDFWDRVTGPEDIKRKLPADDVRLLRVLSRLPGYRLTAGELRDRKITRWHKAQLILEYNRDLPEGRADDRQPAVAPPDLISYADIEVLTGVDKKTIQNRVAEWRRKCEKIADPCSYALIQPFLKEAWGDVLFPTEFALMRAILAAKRAGL